MLDICSKKVFYFQMISSLDIVVLIILLLLMARGIWIGFIRQLASILALILAFVAAGRFYGESASLVTPYVNNSQAGFLIAYLVVFLVVFFGVHLLGIVLKKVISISMLGWFDRTLGGVFGLAKGVFITTLLFMVVAAFLPNANELFKKSLLAPYLEQSSQFILTVVKDKKIRTDFLPKEPAISTFLSNSIHFGEEADRKPQK